MKVAIVSLGCAKNLVDSELILGSLKKAGHCISSEDKADAIVVNTCGFIGDAVKESIDTILELADFKRRGRCRKLIVTGCLVERYREKLKEELPEVDAFWGTGSLHRIAELLEEAIPTPYISPPGAIYDPDSPRVLITPSHTAYVKVSEGCSRTCSFCIIPRLRGKMRSRSLDSVIHEVRELAERGVKEINLIAQDLTSYGRDIGTSLETLLRRLVDVDGIKWIRLHYCYPWGFSEPLLELIAGEDKIASYIDMPIQHINDRILKLMERGTTSRHIKELIERLRTHIPDLTLRTTFIVGFPTETEEEFSELLDFIEEARFERAGAFRYSHEEGTKAGEMDDTVSEEDKEERYERLMDVQSRISLSHNLRLVGSVQEAIIDDKEDGMYIARLSSQALDVDGVTYVASQKKLNPGEIVKVKITRADFYDLYAELEGK